MRYLLNLQNGKSVIYESELSKERYEYYTTLREKVYEYNKLKKQ